MATATMSPAATPCRAQLPRKRGGTRSSSRIGQRGTRHRPPPAASGVAIAHGRETGMHAVEGRPCRARCRSIRRAALRARRDSSDVDRPRGSTSSPAERQVASASSAIASPMAASDADGLFGRCWLRGIPTSDARAGRQQQAPGDECAMRATASASSCRSRLDQAVESHALPSVGADDGGGSTSASAGHAAIRAMAASRAAASSVRADDAQDPRQAPGAADCDSHAARIGAARAGRRVGVSVAA